MDEATHAYNIRAYVGSAPSDEENAFIKRCANNYWAGSSIIGAENLGRSEYDMLELPEVIIQGEVTVVKQTSVEELLQTFIKQNDKEVEKLKHKITFIIKRLYNHLASTAYSSVKNCVDTILENFETILSLDDRFVEIKKVNERNDPWLIPDHYKKHHYELKNKKYLDRFYFNLKIEFEINNENSLYFIVPFEIWQGVDNIREFNITKKNIDINIEEGPSSSWLYGLSE